MIQLNPSKDISEPVNFKKILSFFIKLIKLSLCV